MSTQALKSERTRSELLDQFFTPRWLAEDLVKFANLVPGDSVLEPSCGNGGLLKLLPNDVSWTGYEVDSDLAAQASRLRKRGSQDAVMNMDFLDVESPARKRFNVAVMNPPFTNCVRHLSLASLLARRVCALVPLSMLAGKQRRSHLWSRCTVKRIVVLDGRPIFDGPANKGVTGKRDMMFVEFCNVVGESLLVMRWKNVLR